MLFSSKIHQLYSLECARLFADRGIPTKVVLDAAVAAVMEEVDLCLVGAEGVMENGGIVNKVSVCGFALKSAPCSLSCDFWSEF